MNDQMDWASFWIGVLAGALGTLAMGFLAWGLWSHWLFA